MPLTELITFKTKLERYNRIIIPRHSRWRYKIEAGELLNANIRVFGSEHYEEEAFLAKMTSDGRLTIPKLTMDGSQAKRRQKPRRRHHGSNPQPRRPPK